MKIINKFENVDVEEMFKTDVRPFRECPIYEVLKLVDSKKIQTKFGESKLITVENSGGEQTRYWAPQGVAKIIEKVPCYMINYGLRESENKKYYHVQFSF